MRLVPKKIFILFIHQLKCGHLQSTSLAPAHTFSSGAGILYSIPGTHFVGYSLMPALQTSGCFLLTQNGVLSLSILLFEIKMSQGARSGDEGGCGITMMHLDVKNCAQLHIPLLLCEIPGHHWAQIFLIPNSSVGIKRTISQFMFTSSAIILNVNLRSYRISSLTRTVFHLPVLLMVIRYAAHLQQGFCLQKTFCASEKTCVLDIASSPKAC